MRIIQVLLLIFIMGSLPAVASAQSVSATMQVSINVIQACSVNFGDGFSGDRDRDSKNIHCGEGDIHRISYHRDHREHSRHQRRQTEFKHDHDGVELTTIEF